LASRASALNVNSRTAASAAKADVGIHAAQPAHSTAIAWYTVAVFLLLYLFSQVDRTIINLLVEPIQAEMGVGDLGMGMLMGPAFGLCYAFAAFPLAWLADRMSRRAVVFFAVIFWACAACASGLARTYEQLFIARMAVGVGEAALLPTAYVLVSQLFARARLATALSVLSMGSVGGIALALGLGGWFSTLATHATHWPLIGTLEPWRLIFILTGAPCFLLALLVFTVPDCGRPAAEVPKEQVRGGSLRAFLAQHRHIAFSAMLGFGLVSLASSALNAWMPTYLTRAYGWTTAQAGGVSALMVVTLASAGKIGSGVIVDRWFAGGCYDAHLRYLLIASMVAAPLTGAAFFMPSAATFLILVSAYYLLPYSNMGYGAAFVQLLTPAHLRARVSALFLFCLNVLAMGVGPLLIGYLSERVFPGPPGLGLSMAIVIGSSLMVAGLALWRVLGAAAGALSAGAAVPTRHDRDDGEKGIGSPDLET
jgi:MFS family permease